jgi:hypothetical protein
MTTFQVLLLGNLFSWTLLGVAVRACWRRRELQPELDLSRRAFGATRRVCTETEALGPLFRPIARAARGLMRRVADVEGELRQVREVSERTVWRQGRAVLGEVFVGGEPRELRELRHTVEQLEALADALARYRGGVGKLRDVAVPLQCVDAELGGRSRRAA